MTNSQSAFRRFLGYAQFRHSAIAWLLIAASCLALWRVQYYVDYEVSLLPWLVGRGWRLYTDIVDQHTPLLAWLLALTGGDPGWPLQAVIVGLHGVTLALAYRVGALLAGGWAGVAAVGLGALWLHVLEASHLWFDGALAPIYLLSVELGVRVIRSPFAVRLSFLMGLVLGMGVLVKQHAGLAAIVVGVWLLWLDKEAWVRRLAAFGLGVGLPVLAAGAWLWSQGVLGDAWYWTVWYNLEGGYARGAVLAPSAGEWVTLGALYACVVAFAVASWLRVVQMRVSLLLLSLVIAASIPAWPRYGRFHLAAAVPLVAVAGGVACVGLWRRAREGHRLALPLVGTALVGVSGLAGAAGVWQVWFDYGQLGTPQAPYAESIAPLRTWVDAQAPAGDPIFVYGLDPLLYRVLEREPPKPFVPQLPWILAARDSEAELWRGVERVDPRVALAAAEWWEGAPRSGIWPGMARYREGARFSLVSYRGARPIEVVGLLRAEE